MPLPLLFEFMAFHDKKQTLLHFPFYAISCKEYLLTSRIQTKAFLIKTKINTVKPCNYNFAAKHAILAHY